jgi:hypothetical protein
MNRADRRNVKRDINKTEKVINKLTPEQLKLIDALGNQKAQKLADARIEEFKGTLDRAIPALIIKCLPDVSMAEVEKMEDYYTELVIEDLEKINKIIKDLKGDNEMVNKAMQKYEADVTAKINELLEKKVNQKQAIEILVTNFPTLSKSMLTNSYKRLKSEWDKNNATEEIDPDVEEAMEKVSEILDMGKDKEIKKVLKEADKVVSDAEKGEVVVAYTIAEQSKEIIVENKEEVEVKGTALKVKSMVVEGENGNYKVCDAGVELTNEGMMLSFENEAALDKFVGEFKQVFAMMGSRA